MNLNHMPFTTTDWNTTERTEHTGERGMAYWRTQYFGPAENRIRVRMVDYTAGYIADHWCEKGHILFVLSGSLTTELADGSKVVLTAGMSYQVGDDTLAHRSRTEVGAQLFIVD